MACTFDGEAGRIVDAWSRIAAAFGDLAKCSCCIELGRGIGQFRQEVAAGLQRAITDNEAFSCEYRTANGEECWIASEARFFDDGGSRRLYGVVREITRRKRAEQEVKATLAELERFNQAMLGREHRILEMKTEVNQLRAKLGLAPAYEVDTTTHEP